MTDTRPAVRPPEVPHPVGAAPSYFRSGPWWIALVEGAGAWVWQPGGSPTWVDGAESADEALDALRQPLHSPPVGSRARDGGDETKVARVRASDRVGVAPDTVVAAELGVSRRLVYEERVRRGLAVASAPSAERQRTDQLVAAAWAKGLRRDVDIAHVAGLSEAAVWSAKRRLNLGGERKRRWTPEDLARVASYPTAAAAAVGMGLTVGQAKAARRRAGGG